MNYPKVSIIIRTKNEERWISSCLSGIVSQTYSDYEIIIVDNESSDGTIAKAKKYPIKIVNIKKYLPGIALNVGIKKSVGEILVFLSGHCIPKNKYWLENLIKDFDLDSKVAGVYGRQEPMNFSSPQSKRDLLITFGLDRIVKIKDTFFHNANSAIRKDIWLKHAFDETVTNIEDRIWAGQVLKDGYKIIYEPNSSVYHYHGIHHDNDDKRIAGTLNTIEKLNSESIDHMPGLKSLDTIEICAFIPIRGLGPIFKGEPILKYTIDRAIESKNIDKIFLFTDSDECANYAKQFNVEVPFIRDKYYSQDFIDLNTVYKYCLEKIEAMNYHPDLVVLLEPTFPLRPSGLIDKLIIEITKLGYDTILPVKLEYNPIWIYKNKSYARLDNGGIPRHLKDPYFSGLPGICTVTYSEYIRSGNPIGENIGTYNIDSPLSSIEMRNEDANNDRLLKIMKEIF